MVTLFPRVGVYHKCVSIELKCNRLRGVRQYMVRNHLFFTCFYRWHVNRAMTHDEEKYPRANQFIPERFLNERGELNDDSTVLAFGFGRR